jgi:anti-anti-sigma factor
MATPLFFRFKSDLQEQPMSAESMPHTLFVTVERAEDKCVVQCCGDLVGSGCDFLQQKVTELLPDNKLVVLDLGDIDFIDSLGLGTLVRLNVRCRQAGCHLQLSNVGNRIKNLLNLTNLLGIFADGRD